MEIICQILPDGNELLTIPQGQWKCYVEEPETYSYFLDLYEREMDAYIESSLGQKLSPLKGDAGAFFERAELRARHLGKFNRERKKFYEYKGRVYLYNVLHGNVGHEVEAVRLNQSEVVHALNELSAPKNSMWRNLVARLVRR